MQECRDALILASSRLLPSWFGDPNSLLGSVSAEMCWVTLVTAVTGQVSVCYVDYHRIMALFGWMRAFWLLKPLKTQAVLESRAGDCQAPWCCHLVFSEMSLHLTWVTVKSAAAAAPCALGNTV